MPMARPRRLRVPAVFAASREHTDFPVENFKKRMREGEPFSSVIGNNNECPDEISKRGEGLMSLVVKMWKPLKKGE
jgi:hypothetical protein